MASSDRLCALSQLASAALCICLAVAAAPIGRAAEIQTLRRGNISEPFSLDPHKAASLWENNIVGDMFIGLFTEDPYGAPVPGLAESWSVSDDGLVWSFTLREASWSDGSPVTATDFVVGMQRALAPETQSQFASMLFMIDGAEAVNQSEAAMSDLGVRAVDERRLEIALIHPAPYLRGLLSQPVTYPAPAHVVESVGDAWVQPDNIAVNGPYTLEEWRADQFVHVRKNDAFFDADQVCFDEVYYYPISDYEVAEERVRSGELDLTSDFPGQRLSILREDLPDYVRVSTYLSTHFLVFNTREAPFDDLRVREALSMVIERERIVADIVGAGQTVANAVVPPRVNSYAGGPAVPWADTSLEHRRDQALRLLQDAGYGPDNPLSFEYRHRNTLDSPAVAVALQSNWSAIAPWVTVEVTAFETAIHYANLMAQDFQVADVSYAADYNDAQSFLHLFETRADALNFPGYSDPGFDELIERANATSDVWQRSKLLAEAEQRMLYSMPIAPMWHEVSKALVNPRVVGWEDNAVAIHRSRFLCPATVGDVATAAE